MSGQLDISSLRDILIYTQIANPNRKSGTRNGLFSLSLSLNTNLGAGSKNEAKVRLPTQNAKEAN